MDVKHITVIGAGTMGRGIAYAGLVGGFGVVLEDVSPAMLDEARAAIRESLAEGVTRGKLSREESQRALERLSVASGIAESCREADLVIEAVPEDMELKLEVFTQLDKFARPAAVLASNTSGLSITEIAAITSRPAQCVGMHFFNPVPKMKLVEIVRGLETSPETIEICLETGRRMGKEVVVVRESPGFVTSRINALIGNEAFAMLEEGIATAEDIDKAVKLGLNHPMGPFELVDLVGLDVRLSILEHLHRALGERFRPSPLLRQYVHAGRLGRKAGRGVYDYRGGKGAGPGAPREAGGKETK
jgi:3-hydroxybutyryl-CoA dehydrogenase